MRLADIYPTIDPQHRLHVFTTLLAYARFPAQKTSETSSDVQALQVAYEAYRGRDDPQNRPF